MEQQKKIRGAWLVTVKEGGAAQDMNGTTGSFKPTHRKENSQHKEQKDVKSMKEG